MVVPFTWRKQMCEGNRVKWGNQSLVLDTQFEIFIWHQVHLLNRKLDIQIWNTPFLEYIFVDH